MLRSLVSMRGSAIIATDGEIGKAYNVFCRGKIRMS